MDSGEQDADGVGHGPGGFVDRSVPGLHKAEFGVRQRPRELQTLTWGPRAIMAAMHHDDRLPDGGQSAGQVKIALAGQDVVDRFLPQGRCPLEELRSDPAVEREMERAVKHGRAQFLSPLFLDAPQDGVNIAMPVHVLPRLGAMRIRSIKRLFDLSHTG